jgi:hypothetical protein
MVPALIDNHTASYVIIPVNKQENKKCLLTKTDFLCGINSVKLRLRSIIELNCY